MYTYIYSRPSSLRHAPRNSTRFMRMTRVCRHTHAHMVYTHINMLYVHIHIYTHVSWATDGCQSYARAEDVVLTMCQYANTHTCTRTHARHKHLTDAMATTRPTTKSACTPTHTQEATYGCLKCDKISISFTKSARALSGLSDEFPAYSSQPRNIFATTSILRHLALKTTAQSPSPNFSASFTSCACVCVCVCVCVWWWWWWWWWFILWKSSRWLLSSRSSRLRFSW